MKNRARKIAALLAVGVVSASMLAACGGSDSSSSSASGSNTSAESTASADSTEASTSTDAADSSSGGAVKGEVNAAGSSALLPLAKAASQSFMEKNPDCVVTVNGGGSGEGLKQVADGAVDIGNSDVFAEEKLDADAAKALTDHKVCVITMAPVVNKDLGVTNLKTEDLIKIFTAKVTNWKEVGGPDEKIMLVTRPSSSGTRALFKDWALNGEEESSNKALETDDSGTLLQTVQQNKGAIGYVALSYLVDNKDVQAVSIDGVEPTLENTYNGKYKVWGYEHMYTNTSKKNAAADAFIEYLMGDDFAPQLEKMGYGASSKMSQDAVNAHNK